MRAKIRPKFRRPAVPPAPIVPPPPALSGQEKLVIGQTAYVEALHQGWFATALEQTKSVFTLASAGVGLALTLLFGANKEVRTWIPGWLLASAILFGLATAACIWVFHANGKLALKLICEEDHEAANGLVQRMHLASLICFFLGIVFLLAAGLAFILVGRYA
jgi:hypothetical protein